MTNIGAYFDLRTPPGHGIPPAATYSLALELCEEAERVGLHSVWFTEHHLFDDGYLPQPLLMAAAAAARTSRVRVGTAVVIPAFLSAPALLEQANVVDLIAGGRLELGLGAGYRVPEFALFGLDPNRRFALLTERVDELRALESSGRITPGAPGGELSLWLGYGGPQGARRAGERGEKLLSANPDLVAPYLQGLEAGGHPVSIARMAGHLSGFISEDPERDWSSVAPQLSYQMDSYNRHAVIGTDAAPPSPIDPDRFRSRGVGARLSNFLFATPEDAAAQLSVFVEGTPIETVFFFVSLGSMSEEMAVAHVRALGRLASLLKGAE